MATLWEQGAADRQVVIDAGAAIRLKRLERFGGELLTTSGVYAEVRDEHARALLQTLPVELKVLEPRPEDIVFAKQFSKATGDFGFLSTNDLDLIALTVRLHREAHLSLKDRPAALETRSEGRAVPFDWGPQRAPATTSTDAGGVQQPATEEDAQGDDGWAVARGRRTRGARAGGLKSDGQRAAELPQSVEDARPDEEAKTMTPPDQTTTTAPSVDTEGGGIPKSDDEQAVRETQDAGDAGAELQEDGDLSEDGSSAGEWVTEENMHRFGIGIQPKADLRVTCATADYSVQNVLLQMGITPLTFDGYAVKSVKLWGLICRACGHFHRDSSKVFCPKCGNDTVVRVPIVVDEDGVPTVVNSGRKLRTKGTVFSMPKPQSGRVWKPIFAEDRV
ncbi:NOB1 [Symbiodinium necroappetens]|uniref:NOB1 protein n=1 Tax=Symbiodinium necroappetens TaxID=1628268 RepID=A0A812T1N7_9DINO|nr:NOB1 [Symbiodinium necroappetens]